MHVHKIPYPMPGSMTIIHFIFPKKFSCEDVYVTSCYLLFLRPNQSFQLQISLQNFCVGFPLLLSGIGKMYCAGNIRCPIPIMSPTVN